MKPTSSPEPRISARSSAISRCTLPRQTHAISRPTTFRQTCSPGARQKLGDRDKFIEQVALLKQPFVKDPRRSIEELIKEQVGRQARREYSSSAGTPALNSSVDSDSNQSS